MMDLAERGLAIIMISSELPEILGMSDRIAVMHQGTIAGILSREEATQQKILSLALGSRSERRNGVFHLIDDESQPGNLSRRLRSAAGYSAGTRLRPAISRAKI